MDLLNLLIAFIQKDLDPRENLILPVMVLRVHHVNGSARCMDQQCFSIGEYRNVGQQEKFGIRMISAQRTGNMV